jgi:hypothetical protein
METERVSGVVGQLLEALPNHRLRLVSIVSVCVCLCVSRPDAAASNLLLVPRSSFLPHGAGPPGIYEFTHTHTLYINTGSHS